MSQKNPYLQSFSKSITSFEKPKKFTFPFYYEPHPLSVSAAQELQKYLENQTDFEHNFGLGKFQNHMPIGKMFGVLVVENNQNEIGYLCAFSGKLADESLPLKFVPPIFNLRKEGDFFKKGENELNQFNKQISALENNTHYKELQIFIAKKTTFIKEELQQLKEKIKIAKKNRKLRRNNAKKTLKPNEFIAFNNILKQESFNDQFLLKELTAYRESQFIKKKNELDFYTLKINNLKTRRKNKSTSLQQQLFDKYQFLNQQKKAKGITAIFPDFEKQKPPAGTGDCAAPKLLQHAFKNNLKPIAMAEFWWGVSPNSEIRKHKSYYPACQGRCKPILSHMLEGIEIEKNLLTENIFEKHNLEIIFEDDVLIVVNKPAEFLSVPGKEISDSVYTRIKKKYPNATGPLIVHRLDMSTSGILLLTKTKEANKILQSQFIKRTVKKRYIALLDGIISKNEGEIKLPLRLDLDDRPRQLVCFEHGKKATTKWKVIERKDNKTRIHLFPITGRTHQLRVHAAHSLGLNTPILGDDLYGKKSDRLHLHAAFIEFEHPTTKEKVQFTLNPNF